MVLVEGLSVEDVDICIAAFEEMKSCAEAEDSGAHYHYLRVFADRICHVEKTDCRVRILGRDIEGKKAHLVSV